MREIAEGAVEFWVGDVGELEGGDDGDFWAAGGVAVTVRVGIDSIGWEDKVAVLVPSTPVQYGGQASLILQNGPLEGIQSYTGSAQVYSNSGLLAFQLESHDGKAIKEALKRIRASPTVEIKEEDLARAKATFLYDLCETYDDTNKFTNMAAQQVAASGHVHELSKLKSAIEGATLEQIKKTVTDVFSSKPSLVTYGNLRELPYLDEI